MTETGEREEAAVCLRSLPAAAAADERRRRLLMPLAGQGKLPPGSVWICPEFSPISESVVSYLPNTNCGNWQRSDVGLFRVDEAGALFSRFDDGRSHTAILSERSLAPDEGGEPGASLPLSDEELHWTFPERLLTWKVLTEASAEEIRDLSVAKYLRRFVDDCEQSPAGLAPFRSAVRRDRGRTVSVAVGYSHAIPPNRRSCRLVSPDAYDPRTKHFAATLGLASATSDHRGAVNVAFGDRSVRAVSESIDRDVWGAIGSSRSHDVVPDF